MGPGSHRAQDRLLRGFRDPRGMDREVFRRLVPRFQASGAGTTGRGPNQGKEHPDAGRPGLETLGQRRRSISGSLPPGHARSFGSGQAQVSPARPDGYLGPLLRQHSSVGPSDRGRRERQPVMRDTLRNAFEHLVRRADHGRAVLQPQDQGASQPGGGLQPSLHGHLPGADPESGACGSRFPAYLHPGRAPACL